MKTPILDMLNRYDSSKAIRMHMPGHKGKGNPAHTFDITELSFSDNLMNAKGVISQSQANYASQVSAKYCRYLVNGSTQGIFALVGSSRGKILTESNCHSTLTRFASLLGKEVVQLPVATVEDIPQCLTIQDIETALLGDKDIGTVILTVPNYFGQSANLKAIYKLCKSKDIILYIDSAHGAHWGLNKLLPNNVVSSCDACVESCHKTLGALTQTAVLLTNNAKLYSVLVEQANIMSTTSPSYLLLASIEDSMNYASNNSRLYDQLHKEIIRFTDNCRAIGYSCVPTDDFTRLVIDCSKLGYNAKAVYSALEKANVYCEMATDRYLVAITTLYDDGVSLDAFFASLNRLKVVADTKWDNSYIDSCFEQLQ